MPFPFCVRNEGDFEKSDGKIWRKEGGTRCKDS